MAMQAPPLETYAASQARKQAEKQGSGGVQELFSSQAYKGLLHACGELVKFICCPCVCVNCGPVVVVEQGSVGVMTKFGVYDRELPPGLIALNVFSQQVEKVCMKMQTIEIPHQAAMTRDNLTVQIDAIIFVTVVDPGRAVFEVEKYHYAVKTLAAATLLRIIAEHDLQQIFADRSALNKKMTDIMQEKCSVWGLSVSSVEIRDITIPPTMQRAMAQIAEATREADSKVIVAEGQRKAAAIFAEAAKTMEAQPLSLQLQWFETLRQIAADKNSTVIVPDSLIGPLSAIARGAASSAQSGTPPTSEYLFVNQKL